MAIELDTGNDSPTGQAARASAKPPLFPWLQRIQVADRILTEPPWFRRVGGEA